MHQIESVADLDALVLVCRDARSKELLGEAVACYRAGAFRSCIVSTWMAIVFDFVHKLRELDLRGDAQARALLMEFERTRAAQNVAAALKFEREVLDKCSDFELLSPLERTDLQRLYDDRNRSAHPAMRAEDERFDPSPELARVHMRTAVETMLGRPATQGKAALAAVQDEVTSALFPKEWAKAKTVLERGPLGRAKPTLVRAFVISSAKRILDNASDRDEAERLAAALRAVAAMNPVEFRRVIDEPAFPEPCRVACGDGRGRRVLRLLALVPDVRALILGAVQIQLEELLVSGSESELADGIHDAIDLPTLAVRALARVAALGKERLTEFVSLSPRREYVDRIVDLYVGSRNYDTANYIADNLILPLAPFIGRDHAAKIAAVAVEPNSQVGGGRLFVSVKARLQEVGTWPTELPQVDAQH